MSVVFTIIAFILGYITCILGVALGTSASEADKTLSHVLYMERVVNRLEHEEMPEGIKDYPTDKVWYVAMKRAIEIVRNGGKGDMEW